MPNHRRRRRGPPAGARRRAPRASRQHLSHPHRSVRPRRPSASTAPPVSVFMRGTVCHLRSRGYPLNRVWRRQHPENGYQTRWPLVHGRRHGTNTNPRDHRPGDRPRDLPHPEPRPRRTRALRAGELHGDPRRRARDRRHRRSDASGAVAGEGVLRRRARGRPLGLPLPRRRRPHRRPPRRPRAVPERHAVATSSASSAWPSTTSSPFERMRWIDPGGSFDAGDRTLHLFKPPVFDGPTTRGLFDPDRCCGRSTRSPA